MEKVILKPWGSEQIVWKKGKQIIKNLIVKEGEQLSLQFHHKRNEDWIVRLGECEITIDDKVYQATANDRFSVPKLSKHRIKAITDTIVEEYSDNYDDKDIVRIEDDYGRIPEKENE